LAAQPRVGAARFAPAPDAVIRDLSSEDAWAAYQLKAPFLDARRSSEYQEGHVAGAWSVPIWEADAAARITEFEARADPSPGTPIVVYCSGGDCEDSRLLAQRLVQLGYRNLFIYRDGFPDWARRGRPQAPGARP
jgi:rhodanese-related sulfurtransferase